MAGPIIALDLTVSRLDRAGSGVYATRLARELSGLLGDRLLTIYHALTKERGSLGHRLATLGRDLWWTQLAATRIAGKRGASLVHFPAGVGPTRPTVPTVITVHDMAVWRFPQSFRLWHRTYARWVLPRAAREARAIITVSRASKADVVEILGIREDQVFVVPNGVDPEFTPLDSEGQAELVRKRYQLPREFILTVGSIEPRKNLRCLLQAVRLLASRTATRNAILVHAGPPGWLAQNVPATVRSLGLAEKVRFLGYVPVSDLAALYRMAKAFVYPSLFEGFGLPVLEAMACGCPVVTSAVPALEEVAGDAALLVDPYSPEDIADALTRFWTDADLRDEFSRRGHRRASQYSWSKTAQQTLEVYRTVLEAGPLTDGPCG